MRIERFRKLIWGVDFMVVLGVVLCGWLFFVSSSAALSYDQPDTWKNRGGRRGGGDIIELPQTEAWSNYGRLLIFPKDGLRPPPPVIEEGPEGAGERQDAVNRLAKLISYHRYLPPTDESRVILELTQAPGKPANLAIGEKIPGSVWMLVDVEEGRAIFKNTKDVDAELGILERKVEEIELPGGEIFAPAPDGTAAGAGPGADPGHIQPGLDAVEISPGKWKFGPRERELLSDKNRVEEIRRSISAQPWKNPETGKYEGLKIRKVKPASYIEKRGVKRGDVLLSINGVAVSSREDVINYIRGPGKGKKQYVIEMLRNGQPIQRVYTP